MMAGWVKEETEEGIKEREQAHTPYMPVICYSKAAELNFSGSVGFLVVFTEDQGGIPVSRRKQLLPIVL